MAGPSAEEAGQYYMIFSFNTDLWGRPDQIARTGGDVSPARLENALTEWIRGVPWVVPAVTSCTHNPPFTMLMYFNYTWADSVWVFQKNKGPSVPAPGTAKPPDHAPPAPPQPERSGAPGKPPGR